MIYLSESISTTEAAPVIVIFGRSPQRGDQLIKLIRGVVDATIYNTVSEHDGMEKIGELSSVDLILISSRYTEGQRNRINKLVEEKNIKCKIIQPGWDYPNKDEDIINDIQQKIGSR